MPHNPESPTYTNRRADAPDAPALARIYNQGIADRNATFETRPRSADEMLTIIANPEFPCVVACHDDQVVAFASTSRYRTRECYAGIAEFSVYVDRDWRGRNAGYVVMQALLVAAHAHGFWKVLSRVFVTNQPSRRLLAKLGFREVGIYQAHAQLDGEWRDVVIVERWLADTPPPSH
jgi:L-amino acid N-acyltransferase YncA